MNRSHRSRYNEALGAWVAIPETATTHGGRTRRRRLSGGLLALASILSLPCAWALDANTLPTGGTVSAGSGTISSTGSTMTINQTSNKLAIDWQSFNIGSAATVNFVQPSASSIALNRILGSEASSIYGKLNANGQVFLVNPNGILFGKGAEVNVGGLLASTLNITNSDFLAGTYHFSGSAGAITNEGTITAADRGYIALLGGQVVNQGTLAAKLGTIALAAGSDMTLDFVGDGLLSVTVNQGALNALADNKQIIQADGGTVLMTAKAADSLIQAVVNNDGIIEARTVDNTSGTIKLLADMTNGVVRAGGQLDASAPNGGDGGFIETSAAQVLMADNLQVSTLAASGQTGTWLIDPYNITISSSGSSNLSIVVSGNPWTVSPTASGSNIYNSTLNAYLASTNVALSTTGAGSEAGNITVNAPVSWSAATTLTLNADSSSGGIFINSSITGSNASSGLVLSAGSGGVSQASGASITVGTLAVSAANGGSVTLTQNNTVANLAASSAAGSFSFTNAQTLNVTGAVSSGGNLSLVTTSGNLTINNLLSGGSSSALTLDAAGDLVLGSAQNWAGSAVNLSYGGAFTLSQGARLTLPNASATLTVNGSNYTLVHDVDELQTLGTDAHYALAEDIDASATSSWNSGAGFVPLANYSGDFLGLGHAIDSLYIQRPSSNQVGLFSTLTGSVSDLTLSNVHVTGYGEVGAVAGVLLGSLVNVNVTGEVTGTGNAVGGLAGSTASGATLQEVSSTASVQGSSAVGGLIGQATGTTLSDAYATGSVQASAGSAGGLIGEVTGSTTLTRVYASGSVQGGTGSSGGLVGNGSTYTSASNAYWDASSTGQSASAGDGTLSGATDIQALPYTQASYAGFDFTNTWVMLAGQTRPMLRSEYSTVIFTPHALQLMALDLTASYKLGANLDLSSSQGGSDVWSASGFVPVGSSASKFTGSFDGRGYTISDLYINRGSTNYVGLFGYTSGATISDVLLDGGSVTGNDDVGALVGYMLGGTLTTSSAQTDTESKSTGESNVGGLVGVNDGGAISGSWAGGNVTGAGYQIGGLVGYNINSGSISASYATGNVTGTNTSAGYGYIGGLVGANGYSGDGGSISGSYATGNVTGSAGPIGGFVGHNEGSITNSYATGSVTGLGSTANVGGFVGVNYVDGTISSAYSTGHVSGATDVGGFAGYNNNSASAISSAYWDTQTSGTSTGIAGGSGGITGKTTAQLQAGLPSGFSSSIWRVYAGYTNPLLRSFLTPLTVTATSGTRSYDGTTTGLGLSYSATVDTSLLLGSATTTLSSKDAGTRTATVTGLYSSQQGYDITSVAGTVTVTKASATVTADSSQVTYNGTTQSVSGFTVSGLVGGETASVLTGVSAGGSGLNAGSYATHASGSDGNYALTFIDGTLTIDKASLTVTALDAAKVADGVAFSGGNGVTYAGFIGSESSAVLSGTLTFGGTSQGARTAGVYTITPSGLSAANYNITYINGRLTITPGASLPRTSGPSEAGLGEAYSSVLAWMGNGDASTRPASPTGASTVTPVPGMDRTATTAHGNIDWRVVDGGIRLPVGLSVCDAAAGCNGTD